MIATSAFIRGSSITFRASCTDAAGNPFQATEATLSISYVDTTGTRRHAAVPMAIVGSLLAATWNSSVASDSMPVHWHIRASSPDQQVAQDGTFRLLAAEANPSTSPR